MSEGTRIIKKYPNRRLYDTERSRYITIHEVRELVQDSVNFQVIDANTREDITRNVLLQIILDQEIGGKPLFTTEILEQMIRFYGNTVQGVFSTYLERSMALFAEQQKRLQDQFPSYYMANPMDAINEITQRNLQIWRDVSESLMNTPRADDAERSANHETHDDPSPSGTSRNRPKRRPPPSR